ETDLDDEQRRGPDHEYSLEPGDRTIHQRRTGDQAQDQQSCAGQSCGKGREEPPQRYPGGQYETCGVTGSPGRVVAVPFRVTGYSSMIPRLSPIMAAWVRSLAPSFERMFLTRPFTVSSVIDSTSAICLLAFPEAISRSTSISALVRASS